MTTLRQDIDFHGLFRKLGHSLEEIRVRALENILSKLEHNLICEHDLIHERHLFIRLLEWFNFTPCAKREEVLQLLYRLSKHWAAAELIQSIGGIEFLTNVRGDLELRLQPTVDKILENVMHLPDAIGQEHAPECIYYKTADSGLCGLSRTSAGDGSVSQNIMAVGGARTSVSPPLTASIFGNHGNISPGYFEREHDTDEVTAEPRLSLKPGDSVNFKMLTFPWLPLTMTDRHVIMSTNRSLQSKEQNLLISACEFLSEVVFQDFPAEIFLQRPQIVKSLMSLLNVGPTIDPALVICAAHTLSDMCKCLQIRIQYFQDPTLYVPKQEFGLSSPSTFSLTGSSSSPSALSSDTLIGWSDRRRRGDGRDQDSSESDGRDSSVGTDSGHAVYETDLEETDSLQNMQLSLPQFAVNVLQGALQNLRTTHQKASMELLRLGFESWKILAVVLSTDLWNSAAESAQDLVERLIRSLETMADLLDYHYHGKCNSGASSSEEGSTIAQQRRVYVGIVSLLSHVLHLVPFDRASHVVPEKLRIVLGKALFDESLAISYPQCHAVLTHFAHLLNLETHRILCQVTQVRQSMHDTCRFMMQARSQTLRPEDAASLADRAITSLPYHLHLPFIEEFVKFFSHLCSRSSTDKNIVSRCTGTFLKMLSHPLLIIRQHTYQILLKTVQANLNPSNEATDAKYKGHLETKFLINSDILYEIICFGLADSDNKVCSLAKEVMFHLLQSRLLLGDVLWSEFASALLKSLPVLQSYVDLTSRFGRRIWTMLDPLVASDNLCLLEKLRGNLRLMLSADAGLRSEVVKRLGWFLANESDSCDRRPVPSSVDVKCLLSLFITETSYYLDEDNSRSVFQEEGMKQVYDIFTADPVDPEVKKSAVDQLAIMLQDPHLHAAFRQNGGLEVILQILHAAVMKPKQGEAQKSQIPYIPACVTILRCLLHCDYTLCHNLSRDASLYHDLLRVSMLLLENKSVAYQVSHIFTLLLFDEVAKFDVSSAHAAHMKRSFSLPAVITQRYRLPFRALAHHTVSPSSVLTPADEDVLKTAGPQEMLRVAWNVAWCGGLDELLQLLKSGGSKIDEICDFNKAMLLTAVDKEILAVSSLKWSLQTGVYAVLNATSHADVSSALTCILMHVATLPFADCISSLNQLNWTSVLERFLSVTPSSTRDENLLLEVLQFICYILELSAPVPEQIQLWLAEKLYDPSGPLIGLLNCALTAGEGREASSGSLGPKRSLDKVLLQFISVFVSSLPYKLHKRLSVPQRRGDLSRKLLLRLNISDGPHFYNLAALESTLICLSHITSRLGWSEECSELDPSALCSLVLNCLLEVVSAFHVGRGGTSMSYMGKGVTKAATLCLRHLAHEMSSTMQDKEWAKNWLYSRQGADAVAEPGLNWMLTLWAYRDAEVRAAGLGIAVALTSTETGRMMVTSNCKHIPGGIWGASFSILLDHSECSIVRQQAALLLVNLTSQVIPSVTAEAAISSSTWQGPVVVDVESNVSLVGLPALLALLHHSQFYQQLVTMLTSFSSSSLLQPILVTTEVPLRSLDSSQVTVTTLGSSVSGSGSQGLLSSHSAPHETSAIHKENLSEPLLRQVSTSTQDVHTSWSTSTAGTARFGAQQDSFSPAPEPECSEGMASITTPCLVAALCQLLRNLSIQAPQDTFTYLNHHNILPVLVSLVHADLLQSLSSQVTTGPHSNSSLLALRDVLRMYDAIVSLLRTCLVLDTPSRMAILTNQATLKAVTSLMLVQCEGTGDLVIECRQMWHSVLSLLISLLQTQSVAALQCLTQVLEPVWSDLCDALVHLLEVSTGETQHLSAACLNFLSLLLMEEARCLVRSADQQLHELATLLHLLDASRANCLTEDGDIQSTGSSLCKVLVKMYELSIGESRPHSQARLSKNSVQVINTLKSLLAVSQTAKRTALDMGLVESLIENVKQTHALLSVKALQVNKPSKKKLRAIAHRNSQCLIYQACASSLSEANEDVVMQELILTINLLRNLLTSNEQVKVSSTHSGLAAGMHKLWPWCLQEPDLMLAVLSLLITFTAQCPVAASSLSATGATVLGPTASHQQVMNSSIIYSITKLAQREVERESVCTSSKVSQLLKLLFTLITSLVLSPECRSLIWKSNFLQEFSNLSPMRSRKARGRQMLDTLWLELGVSLSFSTDGQQMLLRLDDCLTVLLDFMENGSGRSQECAILILRNMCCHAANKPKILANEQVIPYCVRLVESAAQPQIQTLAASALWGLAYNNHKAKMAMKNVNVLVRLQAWLKNLRNMGKAFEDVRCLENIQAVISLITE